MKTFAEVGDEVIYTGDVSYAFGTHIASLLNGFFEPKKEYIVEGVGFLINGRRYYKIKGFGYLYPCECFEKKNREYIKILYNLK